MYLSILSRRLQGCLSPRVLWPPWKLCDWVSRNRLFEYGFHTLKRTMFVVLTWCKVPWPRKLKVTLGKIKDNWLWIFSTRVMIVANSLECCCPCFVKSHGIHPCCVLAVWRRRETTRSLPEEATAIFYLSTSVTVGLFSMGWRITLGHSLGQ